MTEQQGREKRPRSLIACSACRKRRSRCEPAPEGSVCRRCQQLRTECSFLPSDNRANSPEWSGTVSGASVSHNWHLSTTDHTLNLEGYRQHSEASMVSPVSGELAMLRMQVIQLQDELNAERQERVQIGASNASNRQSGSDPLHNSINKSFAYQSGSTPEDVIAHRGPPVVAAAEGTSGSRCQAADYRGATDPEAFSLVSRGMGDISERGLKDPVSEGIISHGQLETAYQTFKHHCSTILPYPSLLTTRSRAPSHPFLRSAFLVYSSRCPSYKTLFNDDQVRQLENNVALNLMAFHRGCPPSLESVYAALILSLLPPGNDSSTVMSDFDPARMVGMAYGQIRELGHSVFIERLVDSLATGTPLPHLKDSLDKARLHFCIMARVSWTNLSRCPSNDLPTSLQPIHLRLLDLLEERGWSCELDKQLKFEYQSLQILMTLSQAWRELERVTTPSILELRKGNLATSEAEIKLSDLRARLWKEEDSLIALPWISAQMTYSKWWMTIRNVWFSYRLPSPLVVPDIQAEWLEGLTLAAKASCDMITLCLKEQWDLNIFPRAVGVALVLCYHSLSMGAVHLKHYYPATSLPTYLDIAQLLDQMQAVLKESALSIRTMLTQAQATLDEYKRQLDVQSRRGSDHGHDEGQGGGPELYNFELGRDSFGIDGNMFDISGMGGIGQTGPIGMRLWDPLMGFNDGWDWQQPDGSGRPFWDRQ